MSRLASRSILIFSNGELYFLPLALAAFRFGLKGALAAHKGLTKDFNFGAVEFPACCYKKKKTPLMRREWGA